LGAQRPEPDDPHALRAWLDVAADRAPRVGADAIAFQIAPKLCANGWSPAAIAQLAHAALGASPFRRCVFLAASSDQGLASSIMEHLPSGAIASGRFELADQAGLSRWLGAIASAGALVSPDTGAAHAAGMLGVPVVDVFETERFDQLSRQWRPWAADSRCIAKPPYAAGAELPLGDRIGAALSELARNPGVAS
jgi:ADP-heptose:LPS heptosyltransferase